MTCGRVTNNNEFVLCVCDREREKRKKEIEWGDEQVTGNSRGLFCLKILREALGSA
jgi:hypothetical protein